MNRKTENRLGYLTGVVAALLYAASVFWLVWMCYTPAKADAPPEMDYMELMIQSVVACDPDMGRWAAQQRDEKIDRAGLPYAKIDWDALDLLARIVWQEAGSDGISQAWRRDVAQVVLNRVASPEFPDTLEDVIYQRGQYSGAGRLASAQPTRDCVLAALEAMEGRGDLPASVVFQANFRQGGGVYRQYYLSPYGTTYFCVSSRPELY